MHLELQIFPQIFEKIQNSPDRILRGLEETDSLKKPDVENLVALSLYWNSTSLNTETQQFFYKNDFLCKYF